MCTCACMHVVMRACVHMRERESVYMRACVCVCVCTRVCAFVLHTRSLARTHIRETTIFKSIFLLTSCGLVDSSSFCTLLNVSHLLKGKRHCSLCNCQMFVVLFTTLLPRVNITALRMFCVTKYTQHIHANHKTLHHSNSKHRGKRSLTF